MADTVRRGGKKNRKHGRNLRKPSCKRYTGEKRWIRNKERRMRKVARNLEKARLARM